MFDVTTARVIEYGTDDASRVIVFQDRTAPATWYMVPEPRLRTQAGQPAFSLRKFSGNQGTSGVCTFEVELYTSEEALRAAERVLQPIYGPITWNQFTWVNGDAFFEYDLPAGDKTVPMLVTRAPSLFGSNVAAFQVELADAAAVNAFKDAFSGTGAVSPFRIRYDMGVLTQLLAGEATVRYTASAAIEFQRKYETRSDKWGNRTTILAETTQLLRESGAGSVDVVWGVGVTDEVKQLVNDWGWSTLEKQVARSVEQARALSQGADGPVTATSDFTETYAEDSTVEWSTPVSSFLPRFDEATWRKVYSEVDNRELVVTFQLVGNPVEGDDYLYTDVEVEIDYPAGATRETFVLVPGDASAVSRVYVASPIGAVFDPTYRYRYTVRFPDGKEYRQQDWIVETKTQVGLRPDQFGIRNVTFAALNVPFEKLVSKVLVDFYDNPPAGYEPKLQTKILTKKTGRQTFLTTYPMPLTNSYDYRLRYVMADGSLVVVEPGPTFGADNADVVNVMDPRSAAINFTVRAIVTNATKGFAEINLTAGYDDPQNPPGNPPPSHAWDAWVPAATRGIHSATDWLFQANPSLQAASFTLSGQIIYGDYDIFQLQDFNAPYRAGPLILRDYENIYSIAIIPSQIDWDVIQSVVVNVFQMPDADGPVASDRQTVTAAHLLPAHLRDASQAGEVDGEPIGLLSYSLFEPTEEIQNFPLFHTLRKSRSKGAFSFYYNASYVYKDKDTPTASTAAEIKNRKQLILPALPTKPEAGPIHFVSLTPDQA